jgi:hypothetical protein
MGNQLKIDNRKKGRGWISKYGKIGGMVRARSGKRKREDERKEEGYDLCKIEFQQKRMPSYFSPIHLKDSSERVWVGKEDIIRYLPAVVFGNGMVELERRERGKH